MLAIPPEHAIAVSVWQTGLSLLIGIGGSFAAFTLLLQSQAARLRPVAVPVAVADGIGVALLLTGAIAGLQYVGIIALQPPGAVVLDRVGLLASLALCGGLCAVCSALLRRVYSFRYQVGAAASLAAAVCLSYLMGLASVTLRVDGTIAIPAAAGSDGAMVLAATAAVLSVASLLLLVMVAALDRRAAARAVQAGLRTTEVANLSFEGLAVERDGMLLSVNSCLCDLVGWEPAALIGQPFATLLPPDDRAAPWAGLRSSDRNVVHRDGHLIPVELLVRPIEYKGATATGIALRDMTRRRRSVAVLHRLAHFDPLTGAANHLLLAERLADALGDAGTDGPVAVLRLGIDRFKAVNEQMGEAAGDTLLVAMAERLGALVRGTDTLARLSGDEFVVVLPAPDGVASIALSLASRIVARLAEPFGVDGQRVTVSVSLGIALHPADAYTADELLRCAGIAMESVKGGARGTYRLFHAAMDQQSQDRRTLQHNLRDAIHEDGLTLQFQPVLNGASRTVEGYEALARWTHSERGSVPPLVFIPAAEDAKLILPLDRWVLERACQAAARWPSAASVAVNMSPAQFREPDVVNQVLATLARCGLPAHRLELEITETVLIADPARAAAVLAQFRQMGIRIALDDFGIGYASLSHLRRFPLDKVKIDRSLIQGIPEDPQAVGMVRDIVSLAHTLGLSVTAEGVETLAQFSLLSAQGCDQMQGFLLGRPSGNPGGKEAMAVFSTPSLAATAAVTAAVPEVALA